MLEQETMIVSTDGRGFYDITARLGELVRLSAISTGLCHVFIQHTSASLMICENADPDVRQDVEGFLARLVPDGDERFRHRSEGPDDMSAHLRNMLTQTSLHLPVTKSALDLGTWQGIYLYEHRYRPHQRKLVITVHD